MSTSPTSSSEVWCQFSAQTTTTSMLHCQIRLIIELQQTLALSCTRVGCKENYVHRPAASISCNVQYLLHAHDACLCVLQEVQYQHMWPTQRRSVTIYDCLATLLSAYLLPGDIQKQ